MAAQNKSEKSMQKSGGGDMAQRWMQMRKEAVSAEAILQGNVRAGLAPTGEVRNLVLNPEGNAVQFVIYESQLPWATLKLPDTSFVAFKDTDLETGVVGEIDVSMAGNPPLQRPDKIEIAVKEADSRLVSNILDTRLEFKNGKAYEIEDLLIHPETGAIVSYVVLAEEGVLFSTERRAIPAGDVKYANGEIRTMLDFADVEKKQRFDTALL